MCKDENCDVDQLCYICNTKCCRAFLSSWSQANKPYCIDETVCAAFHLCTDRSHLVLYSELLDEEHPQVNCCLMFLLQFLGVAELFQPSRTTPFYNVCLPLSGTNPNGVGSGLAFCECFAVLGSRPLLCHMQQKYRKTRCRPLSRSIPSDSPEETLASGCKE